jgi:hypothetical protein
MAKTRKLSLRVDEDTYQILTRGAKALDVSLSEYIRLLSMRSAEVLNLAVADGDYRYFLRDPAEDEEPRSERFGWKAGDLTITHADGTKESV